MSISTDTSTDSGQSTSQAESKPRLFNVTEYYMMAEAGIIRSDESLELLEGRILENIH